MFNPNVIRDDFPILKTLIGKYPLVYLDNAATTQIPIPTLNVINEQYNYYQANVHRGIHKLSEMSTRRLEDSRTAISRFLNAKEADEIIFTSGTTDSINIAALSLSLMGLKPGDEIVTTAMEHHSNLVPWQEAAKRTGASLKVLPFDENGELRIDLLPEYITENTKIVACCAVSNVLGTVNPIRTIINAAHEAGAITLIDAAQAVRHERIDVQELDCDLLAFSGHKIMGPTGTGVLYGKREILEKMPAVRFGGGMVDTVYEDHASYGEIPFKFEAGTPNIVGNIALGAAIKHFESLGEEVYKYEEELLSYTLKKMKEISDINIVGDPKKRSGVVSFNVEGMHYFDIAALLDKLGIAVRSGHHCAQPLLRCFGLDGAVRVSPAYYNTKEEIDQFISSLKRIISLIRRP